MGKIYVVGLGPGSISALTLGAVERINSGDSIFLRTEKHPTVEYLKERNIPYKTYDYLYEDEEDFKDVYERIVEELIVESKDKVINYFVPGNPLLAEKTVEILKRNDVDIEIISGMSFIEPLIELVDRDPIGGLKLVDGSVFDILDVDIGIDTIITQVYNRRILSEIKIGLSEVYGDEYMIYAIHSAGVERDEDKQFIHIYELDRIDEVGPLTSLYIPKIDKVDKKIFDFNDLLGIIRLLRSKDGCPWDMEQTHKSIRACMLEEAYELVDAIDRGDIDNLSEELGDVLLQVLLHSEIGYEEGEFNIYEVMSTLANKLIYRHPHVFKEKKLVNSSEIVYNWNELKYDKRNIEKISDKFKDIPRLPALMRSFKIQEKAAEVGFDWEDVGEPLNKIMEEYGEMVEAIEEFPLGDKHIEEELGDLLFAVVNTSRFLRVNPEVALNKTIGKFTSRFEFIESSAEKSDKKLEDMSLKEMDQLWNKAKLYEDLN